MIRFRFIKDRDITEKLQVFVPWLLITIVGFIAAYQFVAPAPPRRITMATGSPTGAYHSAGKHYREILAKDGITLELKHTSGSVENLQLLEDESNGVDLAFVQGGLQPLAQTDNLVSLGSIFYEPMWFFHRSGISIHQVADLLRLRVAVGPEGSGSKALTLQMLDLNGINPSNASIFPYGSQKAADLLLAGEIDVAIFVASHRADHIRRLFQSNTAVLLGIKRAEAYAIRLPFLHVLKLPEGVIDFKENIPPRDLMLVAPTAQLVARPDLHPALIDLLLQAAEKVHSKGGGFEKEGQFPTPRYIDFKLSDEAARYYKSGPPFLQRYLPFWVANFIARMTVMLLPLVALLFPLFKLIPAVYRWRMRSRIYRWYGKLEAIDALIIERKHIANPSQYMTELNELEQNVSHITVPLAFQEELYDLRLHIDLLRKKLEKESGSISARAEENAL